jgi:transitional endoplasmic reticulum ATPase
MRFTVRLGSDPVGRADPALLAAMGLPGGGVVRLGPTHVQVGPGSAPGPTDLVLDATTLRNAGVSAGSTVDAVRAILPPAVRVTFAEDPLPVDPRVIARALAGRPVTTGDRVPVADQGTDPVVLTVAEVMPNGSGLFGPATAIGPADAPARPAAPHREPTTDAPTTADALLAGLDADLEMLSGWIQLLTSTRDLPSAWGLPKVAGVVVEGPQGCGRTELVAAAAQRAGATVREVGVDLVFKPERLVDVLEAAVRTTPTPGVVFVDRLDAVVGADAMFRTQTAAIMRWFLDAVAERPRLACVLGVSSTAAIDDSVISSPLLPRTLTVPPPDLRRRELLFRSALHQVPTDSVDHAALAARTAGFSAVDVIAAVVHASAMSAGSGRPVTTDDLLAAAAGIRPSLGSVPTGDIPSHGFEVVANLAEVKQRLTEAVIWPMTDPDRFRRLGIEPPRGILLYGPPGTGKTFVVRALAHESGAAFFSVKGAELLDKFVGESERGVRELFSRARAAAPSIIFFDEIDAIAPVRGRSTTSVTDSVVAALLTEMDGVAERGDVVVIGATNRIDLVDPALLRGGRLETHIELGLPDREARLALFAVADVPFADDVDVAALADATEGLSFADLTGLLREAALQALRADQGALTVGSAELRSALAALGR